MNSIARFLTKLSIFWFSNFSGQRDNLLSTAMFGLWLFSKMHSIQNCRIWEENTSERALSCSAESCGILPPLPPLLFVSSTASLFPPSSSRSLLKIFPQYKRPRLWWLKKGCPQRLLYIIASSRINVEILASSKSLLSDFKNVLKVRRASYKEKRQSTLGFWRGAISGFEWPSEQSSLNVPVTKLEWSLCLFRNFLRSFLCFLQLLCSKKFHFYICVFTKRHKYRAISTQSKIKFQACFFPPLNVCKNGVPYFDSSSFLSFPDPMIFCPTLCGTWFEALKERTEQIICVMKCFVVAPDDKNSSSWAFHDNRLGKHSVTLSPNVSTKCWIPLSLQPKEQWELLC